MLRVERRLLMLTAATATAIRRSATATRRTNHESWMGHMNAERKRLVQESWEAIAPEHDRVATRFYERLFEIQPSARGLFAKTDMIEQRAKFVIMLGEIVRNLRLARRPHSIAIRAGAPSRRLWRTGHRLRSRARSAVRRAGRRACRSFHRRVRDAWEEAYALTAGVMQRGAGARN